MYRIPKSFNPPIMKTGQVQVMLSRNIFRHCFFFGTKPQPQLKRFQHGSTLQTAAILSKENRARCMSVLQSLKSSGGRNSQQLKKAAVLVPLCTVNKQLSLLYTLRSSNLKTYRGQVSFPGGMNDQSDKTLEDTALRETFEELGIKREQIDLWGHVNFMNTARGDTTVMPFIGYLGEVNCKKLAVNPEEVESVFTVPLGLLCNPSSCKHTQFRGNYVLPVYLGTDEPRIWGMTAMITHILLTALIPGQYKHKLVYMPMVGGQEHAKHY